MTKSIEDVCFEIASTRESACGKATCIVEDHEFDFEKETRAPESVIDEFMKKSGFISGARQPISRRHAEKIISDILHKDLAYKSKISETDYAETRARSFIEIFSEDAVFFSNGMIAKDGDNYGGWFPATPATFDTGVAVLDKARIGILWVEDED